ncbi:MAG: RCC1 repeat-containing protein, partial [Proteobacteria bacterium]
VFGLANGTVKAVGSSVAGELGNNTTTSACIPVNVCGVSNAISVSAGYQNSFALLSSQLVMAWGQGTHGAIGNNSNASRSTPTQVCGISNAIAIMAGVADIGYVLLADGTIKSWGSNQYGGLGAGLPTSARCSTPVSVSGLSGIVAVGAGWGHGLAH